MAKTGTYTTASGIELHLRGVPPPYVMRWGAEYRKKYPEPIPPTIYEQVVDTMVERKDYNDSAYLEAKQNYDLAQAQSMQEWFWGSYIANDVPDDFDPDPLVFGEREMTANLRRSLWVESLMESLDEQTELFTMHMGLTMPTPEGISDAEKNTTSE